MYIYYREKKSLPDKTVEPCTARCRRQHPFPDALALEAFAKKHKRTAELVVRPSPDAKNTAMLTCIPPHMRMDEFRPLA